MRDSPRSPTAKTNGSSCEGYRIVKSQQNKTSRRPLATTYYTPVATSSYRGTVAPLLILPPSLLSFLLKGPTSLALVFHRSPCAPPFSSGLVGISLCNSTLFYIWSIEASRLAPRSFRTRGETPAHPGVHLRSHPRRYVCSSTARSGTYSQCTHAHICDRMARKSPLRQRGETAAPAPHRVARGKLGSPTPRSKLGTPHDYSIWK